MASTIIMPQLGETVAEGKILAWFKSVGDEVKEGDNLFEVDTHKVTIEVQAVAAGRLSEIRVGAGVTAKVGDVVAVLSDSAKAATRGNSSMKAPSPDDASAKKAAQWRSPFDRVRRARKEGFQTAQGFALTFLPFIARATCLATSAYPQINARFDGKALRLSRDVNLGIAVDLDHNGLVVPVVRNAGELTLIGLAKAVSRQIDKAKSSKLSLDDLSGGTYSISNNGAFGATLTVPIINAPQVGILSVDAIRLKPVVVSTPEGDFVAPRMIGMIGQSFDHRAFDGAYSGAFLSRLEHILETRNWDEEFPSDP